MMGAAGLSLALTGGTSASVAGTGSDIPSSDTKLHHEITLDEEEILMSAC